jgi:hypothetical protein
MVTLLDGMLPDEAIPLDEFVIAPLLEGQLITDELEELIPPPDVAWLLEGLVVAPLLDGELPLDETVSPVDDPESALPLDCEELGEPLEEIESDPELIVRLDGSDEDELLTSLEELLDEEDGCSQSPTSVMLTGPGWKFPASIGFLVPHGNISDTAMVMPPGEFTSAQKQFPSNNGICTNIAVPPCCCQLLASIGV